MATITRTMVHTVMSIERFSTEKIESLYNLASLFEIEKNYDSSLIYFFKVAKKDSTFKNVYGSIGRIYLYKNELTNSLNYLTRSLIQDSTNYSTLSNLGGVYYYYHNYDKAIEYYGKCIRYNQNDCPDYKNLEVCWYQKKNYKKALEYYNLAYQCKPENDVLMMISNLKKL